MKLGLDLKIFFTLWLVYAVYATPAGGVTPNRYVDLVHSIVNEGRFEIDTYHDNTIDKAFFDGHYYMGALPGPSFFAVPPYVAFKGIYALLPERIKSASEGIQSFKTDKSAPGSFYRQIDNLEFFLSQLFLHAAVVAMISALGSLYIFKTIKLVTGSPEAALSSTVLYALGTMVFFYSTLLFEQIFTATLLCCLLYMATRLTLAGNRRNQIASIFLMGLVAGLDTLIEPTSIFLIFGIGLWILMLAGVKKTLLFGAGLLIPVCVLLGYNYVLFGNPISFVYSHLIDTFKESNSVGLFGVSAPRLDRLWEVTFGTSRGLFLYAPITAIGLIGLIGEAWTSRGKTPAAVISLLMIGEYLVFLSAYAVWNSGAAFGPRYLISVLPLFAMGVGFAFAYLPHRLIYAVGIVSVVINWTGAMFGFADSPLQSLQRLADSGPILPVFGAVLSHSSSLNSLYNLASQLAVPITVTLTLLLAVPFFLIWRNMKSALVQGIPHEG